MVSITPNMRQSPFLERMTEVFALPVQNPSLEYYTRVFFPAVLEFYGELYEPGLELLLKYIEERGRPDVMVSSMFAENGIDWANHYDIPLAIIYATPLGSLAGYEDHVAAPDTSFWAPVGDHGSIGARAAKVYKTIRLIMSLLPSIGRIAALREKHGLAPTSGSLDNWKCAVVFHTWSLGLDVARPTRPLTVTTGLLSEPYVEPASGLTKEDKDLKERLDKAIGGVVYAAFGSYGILTQEMFDNIVGGIAKWASSVSEGETLAIFALSPLASNAANLDLSNVPPSVSVVSWTNQKLILYHPNTRAFITHGGQGSIAEAVYARVPMLAIPLFGDQPTNPYRIKESGIGLSIHFREDPLTSEGVFEKLCELTMPSHATKFQQAMDRQYIINARSGGASKAADYIEDMFLLGHLDHLIPVTDDVPFPGNINLDLYLLFIGALLVVLFGTYKLFRLALSMVISTGSKTKEKKA